MKSTIYYSDLSVLKALFGPANGEAILYNPHEQNIVDLPKAQIVFHQKSALLAFLEAHPGKDYLLFNCTDEDLLDLYCRPEIQSIIRFTSPKTAGSKEALYYTINKPDGSIRWIIPASNQYPGFLNLQNSNNLKIKAYRHLVRQLFNRGMHQLLASGSFVFFHKGPHPLEKYFKDIPAKEYSIYTGSPGLKRKAIIELGQQGQSSHFLKWPIEKGSRELLKNEETAIQMMSDKAIPGLTLPGAQWLGPGLLQSNVKEGRQYSSDSLSAIHIQVLTKCYQKTARSVPLAQVPSYQEIGQCLNRIKEGALLLNGLNPETIGQLRDRLDQHYQALDPATTITYAWAHGDFTPWNMYLNKEKLALYDLEMSRTDLPLLYDAFHFIFQSAILIHRYSYTRIRSQLRALQQMPLVQQLIQQYQIDFDLHLRFYLLHTVSYHLEQYIQQSRLDMQVHLLIAVWLESLRGMELYPTVAKHKAVSMP